MILVITVMLMTSGSRGAAEVNIIHFGMIELELFDPFELVPLRHTVVQHNATKQICQCQFGEDISLQLKLGLRDFCTEILLCRALLLLKLRLQEFNRRREAKEEAISEQKSKEMKAK